MNVSPLTFFLIVLGFWAVCILIGLVVANLPSWRSGTPLGEDYTPNP